LVQSIYTQEEAIMAATMTSIRLDIRLADEAAKVLGVKSRTEAVHAALREVVALKKFQALMAKHGGKLRFEAHGE
jgi:Arc/MetJ family transcription regulator